MNMLKQPAIRSKKLRDSAQGQECSIGVPGVCSHNREETVLCHFPDESHGMARKSDDISAGFGCNQCHAVIDGRHTVKLSHEEKEFYMRRAMVRTWRIWIGNGLVRIE